MCVCVYVVFSLCVKVGTVVTVDSNKSVSSGWKLNCNGKERKKEIGRSVHVNHENNNNKKEGQWRWMVTRGRKRHEREKERGEFLISVGVQEAVFSVFFFFQGSLFFFFSNRIIIFFSETDCRNTHNVPTQRDAHFQTNKQTYIYVIDWKKKKEPRQTYFFFSELRWVSATSHNRVSHKILLFFSLIFFFALFSKETNNNEL